MTEGNGECANSSWLVTLSAVHITAPLANKPYLPYRIDYLKGYICVVKYFVYLTGWSQIIEISTIEVTLTH